MERTEQRERVKVMDADRHGMVAEVLATGGMVAFLIGLALLFIATAPA